MKNASAREAAERLDADVMLNHVTGCLVSKIAELSAWR